MYDLQLHPQFPGCYTPLAFDIDLVRKGLYPISTLPVGLGEIINFYADHWLDMWDEQDMEAEMDAYYEGDT